MTRPGGRGRLALPDVPPGEHREKPHPTISATFGPAQRRTVLKRQKAPDHSRASASRLRPKVDAASPPVGTAPPLNREPLRLGVTARHESCVFLHRLFAKQGPTPPPPR